jgi:hypothetical protein
MDTLHEVVERLAPLNRPPCSPGEREAAEWLARRFEQAGCFDVRMEDEPSWGTFPANVVTVSAVGLAGAALSLAGRRITGAMLTVLSLLGLADEAQNGPRILRRLIRRRQQTVNVVAKTGDPHAQRVLVMLGHHDAAQTGIIFDQSMVKAAHARFPEFIEARKQPPPQWWIGAAAPLLVLAGSVLRRRSLIAAGAGLGAAGAALIADIGRNPTVPGANDNLSGVAVLMAVAEALNDRPVEGLQVWLVSAGAEETMQDGIRAFFDRHGSELRERAVACLNYDTVGSPNLGMLEGEGPLWMEKYKGKWFRDLIERVAREHGIALERGLTARSSTDSVISNRAGLPTTCLVSLTDYRTLANYHLPSDTPENLDYDTVASAASLGEAVARELALQDVAAPVEA